MLSTRTKMVGAMGLAVFALIVTACNKQAVAENPRVTTKSAETVALGAAPATPLAVNDLAANASSHLGLVSLVGVVGTVNEKKGFVVVDTREYKECGLSCLTEAGTKKIPVRWSGPVPKVENTVRIDGQLVKDEKGYALTAEKVTKQ